MSKHLAWIRQAWHSNEGEDVNLHCGKRLTNTSETFSIPLLLSPILVGSLIRFLIDYPHWLGGGDLNRWRPSPKRPRRYPKGWQWKQRVFSLLQGYEDKKGIGCVPRPSHSRRSCQDYGPFEKTDRSCWVRGWMQSFLGLVGEIEWGSGRPKWGRGLGFLIGMRESSGREKEKKGGGSWYGF